MLLPLYYRAQQALLRRRGFDGRRVETSRGAVHVLDAPGTGAAPPVVVLHGIGASAIHFCAVLPGLQRAHTRVLAPDIPGHGASPVPSGGMTAEAIEEGLAEALDRCCPEPAIVAGNSMGGFAAIRYAARRPERVAGLVLLSPGGAGGDAARLDTLMPRFDMQDRAAAAAFLRRIHARPPWYVPVIAGDVRRDFYRPPMQELVRQIRAEQLLRPEEVSGLRMPVLFVWGKHENLLLPEHRAFFLRHLPAHARVEEPDDFGHCPHLDAPARVAAMINDFSSTILASSAA